MHSGWLTGTATTKDVNSIKTRINQLITTQHNQQETLVHVISILIVTRYTTQVNRQHINIVMSTAEKMHQDVATLYNITHYLYSNLSYKQIVHPHLFCSGKPLGFSVLQERSHHTHHGLHWCSNNRNTLTTCTTGRRSQRNAITPLRKQFLPPCTYQFHQKIHSISADTYSPMCWLQVNNSYYWLMYQFRIMHNNLKYMKYLIWLYLMETSQYTKSYTNGYLGIMNDETKAVEISEASIQNMPKCQRTVFQSKHTPSTTGQPTNVDISFIYQGQS